MLAAALLDLLYPPRCAVCRALGTDALCGTITPLNAPCTRCGHARRGQGCQECHRDPPAFDGALALGVYDGTLKAAVHRFKFRDRPQLAEPLGILLARHAQTHASILNELDFHALLPVPMHPARRRVRGYNQSERLARVVSRALDIPLETKLLTRPRPTRPQVGLEADARHANLSGAFCVPRPDAVQSKVFLLVDDVSTTGSTLSECAAALKQSGADAVYALTLAAG